MNRIYKNIGYHIGKRQRAEILRTIVEYYFTDAANRDDET